MDGFIGVWKRHGKDGATGVNNSAGGDELFAEYMEDMKKSVSYLLDDFQKTPDSGTPSIEVTIREAIQKEVRGEIEGKNEQVD